jgi:DNA-binding MarR family transcriptional regulator
MKNARASARQPVSDDIEPAQPNLPASRNPELEIDFGILPTLVGYRLRIAQQRVFANFAKHFSPYGIVPSQLGLLILVERNPGLKQTALAEALGIDRSTIVGLLDKLEASRLVKRTPDTKDRRAYRIALNGPTAHARFLELMQVLARHEQEIAALLELNPTSPASDVG